MRRTCKLIILASAMVILTGSLTTARKGRIVLPFDSRIEVDPIPEQVGPVELQLVFGAPPRPLWDCEAIQVSVVTEGDIDYDGPAILAVHLTDTLSYRGAFAVTIPPSEGTVPSVSTMRITISCGDVSYTHTASFVTLGRMLKYVPGKLYQSAEKFFPELKPSPPPAPKSRADQYWERFGLTRKMFLDRSSMTEEQLQTKHAMAIDLSDPEDLAFARGLLGSIPESAAVSGVKGGYILDLTLDHLLRISEHGIELDFAEDFRKRLLERKGKQPDEAPPDEDSTSEERS